ncbi:phosphatase 2C-like domain-containing protein [Ochromonadaceae sp. CCMP2298]|nr:phosphatase 2C-like domain-containing protein [Ochromonadaceae sp. CCMP2298]
MRGRSQSRGGNRYNVKSYATTGIAKKGTRLPMIAGANDGVPQGLSVQSSGLVVGVCTQQGKRPYQEDEYTARLFLDQSVPAEARTGAETHMFGLFDGHAGGRCSNYVTNHLPQVLAEDPAFFSNLPLALKRSFHSANDAFLRIAEKMKYHDGSTGLVAVVRDSKVLVANVGDCRALIISAGRPIQMSIDQKPTSAEEQKRIASLGGTVVYCMGVARVNRVLAVSRAFGNRTLRSVIRPDAEMMQRELCKEDDFLVMASDGLWDVLKNRDVAETCYSPTLQGSPQAIADRLVQAALMRGVSSAYPRYAVDMLYAVFYMYYSICCMLVAGCWMQYVICTVNILCSII